MTIKKLIIAILVLTIFLTVQKSAQAGDNSNDVNGNIPVVYEFINGAQLIYNFNAGAELDEVSFLDPRTKLVYTIFKGQINTATVNVNYPDPEHNALQKVNGNDIIFGVRNSGEYIQVAVNDQYYVVSLDGSVYPVPFSRNVKPEGIWNVQIARGTSESVTVISHQTKEKIYFAAINNRTQRVETFEMAVSSEKSRFKINYIATLSNDRQLTFLRYHEQTGTYITYQDGHGQNAPTLDILKFTEDLPFTPEVVRIRKASPNYQSKVRGQLNLDNRLSYVAKELGVNPEEPFKDESDGSRLKSADKNADANKNGDQDVIQDAVPNTRDNKELLKKELDAFTAILNKRIIGQPEVIAAAKKIEIRNYITRFNRELPELLLFMGLPGTGKDTATEAITDAMYKRDKAYKTHLFRLPVVTGKEDMTSLTGSSTGHIGSDGVTSLQRFLAAHSGGRYQIKVEKNPHGKTEESIAENPEWQGSEKVLEGQRPERAVIYISGFERWSKSMKDSFLKETLDQGFVRVSNSVKGGVDKMYVPVLYIIATNEGSELLTAREPDGRRYGAPLNYDEMMVKWPNVSKNYGRLRDSLMETNHIENTGGKAEHAPGISQDLVNRFQNWQMLLFRPLSVKDLQTITRQKLESLNVRLGGAKAPVLSWSNKLVAFLQEYQYVAEDNARPVIDRITSFVEDPLFEAFSEGKIEMPTARYPIELDITQNPDRTYSLVIKRDNIKTELVLEGTLHEREAVRLTDAQLRKILTLGERLKKRVFGAEVVIDEIAKAVVLTQERRGNNKNTVNDNKEAVKVFGLFGPTSTGKTETARSLAIELYGNEKAMHAFDFGSVTNKDDLKVKILGQKVGDKVIKSEFMKIYDRTEGNFMATLDEIGNAPPWVLSALFDILREPTVRTFADGKPRSMGNVTLIMTANIGQEWYSQIPTHIPQEQQQAARETIYKESVKSESIRRATIYKSLSEPMAARIGFENMFFYSPINYKTIRELSQLKLSLALEDLKITEGRRGWEVLFASPNDYLATVKLIETEGFVIKDQGASIDHFVKKIRDELRVFLLSKNVPLGSKVVLTALPIIPKDNKFKYKIQTPSGVYVLSLGMRTLQEHVKMTDSVHIMTAYHEAGHELVRRVLFGKKFQSQRLTIMPGVAEIMGQWIVYLGLAQHEKKEYFKQGLEAVIRDMAVNAGGYVAQMLIDKHGGHDAGKSNDMEQSMELAVDTVLRSGLSEAWGKTALPHGKSVNEFLQTLSDADRKLYQTEIRKLFVESELLARQVLLNNFDSVLAPLALTIAKEGDLNQERIEKFYQEYDSKIDYKSHMKLSNRWYAMAQLKMSELRNFSLNPRRSLDPEFKAGVPLPLGVARIKEITDKRRDDLVNQVVFPENIPLQNGKMMDLNSAREKALVALSGKNSCKAKLQGLAKGLTL
ncbi:MAG: hypothetical protein SGI74_12685 [Oligoflexia bacterium]|nr:hypothetical protein [Oligoflexia bacterium]